MKQITALLLTFLLVIFAAAAAPAAMLKNGTVLHVVGSNEYYIYTNGYAAHIPSISIYKCLGLEQKNTVQISREKLNEMKKTAFLIRDSGQKIYRVDGDTKRHVPNIDVFKKLGFNESEVFTFPDNEVRCIPEGPPLH
jgi:hypothetical protein